MAEPDGEGQKASEDATPWEPTHITRDEFVLKLLELAKEEGYTDPSLSTEVEDSDDTWKFAFFLTSIETEFYLFAPKEPTDSEGSAPYDLTDEEYSLTEEEYEKVQTLGDLVDPLGKYIKKGHEAREAYNRAEADYWERLQRLADTLEADGIRMVRDVEGTPFAVIKPDSNGKSLFRKDFSDSLGMPVEHIDGLVRKWEPDQEDPVSSPQSISAVNDYPSPSTFSRPDALALDEIDRLAGVAIEAMGLNLARLQTTEYGRLLLHGGMGGFLDGVRSGCMHVLDPKEEFRVLIEQGPAHVSVVVYAGMISAIDEITKIPNDDLPIEVRGFMATFSLFAWGEVLESGVRIEPGRQNTPAAIFDRLEVIPNETNGESSP